MATENPVNDTSRVTLVYSEGHDNICQWNTEREEEK